MKNQYFGDVNDYLKYGLLRCFSDASWRVGVCWMLTPNDRRSDGGKRDYLSGGNAWRRHDPCLFDALKPTLGAGAPRDVALIEDRPLIANARFFSETVPDNKPRSSVENISRRGAWFGGALNALSSCNLLFFDPDNGLEVPSRPPGSRHSAKYVWWGEIQQAWERGASLLIFQHFTREKRQPFVDRLKGQLEGKASRAVVTPLSSAHVLFLLACQPQHGDMAKVALKLVRSRWQERLREATEQ